MITPRSMNFIKKAGCLNSKRLSQLSQQKSVKQFRKLVLELTASKTISTEDDDEWIKEIWDVLSNPITSSKIHSYLLSEQLDNFYFKTLEIKKYNSLSL